MTLYEIDQSIQAAIESMLLSVDEETGEVDEELAMALDELKEEKANKLDAIGAYIKNLMAEAEAIKEEVEKLQARKKSKEAHVERLKEYVKCSMAIDGDTKFESARVAFSFRKSEAVEIDEGAELPEKYMKIVTTSKPDKTAIKTAIKSGEEVPGARIVINQNLQMK